MPGPPQTRPTHAHASLTRLGGVNLKIPVQYRGNSVFLTVQDETYRIRADRFLAGENQFRDSWSLRVWDARAEKTAMDEADWQT